MQLAGVIQLLFFLSRYIYLIGVWFGEDQIINTIKTHVYKRLDYVFKILLTSLDSIMKTNGHAM